ncbi:MAG: InlB B-repeat-containing protein, partial [Alphaproteobacteria bacterium]|nr:InlB B-repeat-containing protein [Alphaproteobacteria bacterium]
MTYRDVYNGTPRAGNACTACPSGWTCSGGTSAPTRTITLNKNGGSGTINGTSGTTSATKTCTYGSSCSFGSASGLTQTGYKFTGGWGTSSSCRVITTSFTNPSSSTYYACKIAQPVYAITLDSKYYATSSTTTGTDVTTNAAPTPIYVKYNTDWYTNSSTTKYFVNLSTLPVYTGYTFGGFYTGKAGTGNQIIDASGKIVKGYTTAFTKNTTLYAKWTPNTVKVTLNNQSATTAGTTVYYYPYNTYNGSCYYFSNSSLTTCLAGATDGTKITIPTKTGYTFGGYYTKENGGGTQYVNASGATVNNIYKAVSSDITLYAKWT